MLVDVADGVPRFGVLFIKLLWKICFLIESPIERHEEGFLSRLKNCNGVPVDNMK